MKRTLLTVISVCLVVAAIFGIYAGVTGTDDVSAIMRYTKSQRGVITEIATVTEEGVIRLEEEEEQHKQDILDATEGTVVDQIGSEQLEQGQQQYDAGKDKLDAGQKQYDEGKKQYDAAKKQYDEKYAQYENACEQLDVAKAQLAEAKTQYAESEDMLNSVTPVYNLIKEYVNLADGKVYEYTKYLADPIAQRYGYASAQDVVVAYEEGKAQLAEASVQIAAAEKQISAAQAQLDDGKRQLDEGKAQLDAAKAQLDASKAQLDAGKKQLAASKAQLDEGRATVEASAEELESVLENLKEYDDAEALVKAGVEELMKIPGIAKNVADESDYRSVIEAAKLFIDTNTDDVNEEMTVRQSLYVLLIAAAIVCAIAGIVGIVAALVPTGAKLNLAAFSAIAAAALSVGFLLYGLLNGSRSFAYTYLDKAGEAAGSGSLQNTALIVLAAVSVCAAVIALMCRSAYRAVLLGGDTEAETETETNDEKTEGMTAEELAEETRKLNEEAARIEEDAQLEALKKAQREYEEAKKRFEEARRSAK